MIYEITFFCYNISNKAKFLAITISNKPKKKIKNLF